MNSKHILLVAAALLASAGAQAGPISVGTVANGTQAVTLGGYAMQDFTDPRLGPEPATSAVSGAGSVGFTDQFGSSLLGSGPFGERMRVGDKNNSGSVAGVDPNDPDETWWSGADDGFYYSDFGFNWLELHLPANTVAFSLTIDSNTAANAWIVALDAMGNGVNTQGETFAPGTINAPSDVDFDIQLRNGVAQSFGFFADNSTGSCNTISTVIVDPTKAWAIGDFAIAVDNTQCGTVPAPVPVGLLGLGMLGLFCSRRFGAAQGA